MAGNAAGVSLLPQPAYRKVALADSGQPDAAATEQPHRPLHLRDVTVGREGRRRKLLAAAALLVCTLCGAVAAHTMLGVTWVEAFYFAVATITTVGYGDINPLQVAKHHHSHAAQNAFLVFHMCYIIIGVSLIGVALSIMVGYEVRCLQLRRATRGPPGVTTAATGHPATQPPSHLNLDKPRSLTKPEHRPHPCLCAAYQVRGHLGRMHSERVVLATSCAALLVQLTMILTLAAYCAAYSDTYYDKHLL